MVMRADVLAASLDAALAPADPRPRLLMSPRGRPLTQARVRELADGPGVDSSAAVSRASTNGLSKRAISKRSRSAIMCSPAASLRLWSCSTPPCGFCPASWARRNRAPRRVSRTAGSNIRIIPSRATSRAAPIPEVLLSGDHAKIAAWRKAEAEALTGARRPDLLAATPLRAKRRNPESKSTGLLWRLRAAHDAIPR